MLSCYYITIIFYPYSKNYIFTLEQKCSLFIELKYLLLLEQKCILSSDQNYLQGLGFVLVHVCCSQHECKWLYTYTYTNSFFIHAIDVGRSSQFKIKILCLPKKIKCSISCTPCYMLLSLTSTTLFSEQSEQQLYQYY